ncbi:MAG: hypothetical protein AAFX52_05355 [Pseudomonadota bacterium]
MRIGRALAVSFAAAIGSATAQDSIEQDNNLALAAEDIADVVEEAQAETNPADAKTDRPNLEGNQPETESASPSTDDAPLDADDELPETERQPVATEGEPTSEDGEPLNAESVLSQDEELLEVPNEPETNRIRRRREERAELREKLEAISNERSRWRFSSALVFAEAEVDIKSVEAEIPDDFVIEDLEIRITDLADISSTAWVNSVGYRVLPFLELSGQVGILQSETVTAFEVSGTPNLGFDLVTFDEPITINLDRGDEADGYTFGLGTRAAAPVAIIGGRPLLGTAGFRYNWNRVDDGNITSESLLSTFGLTYAVPTEKALYTFSAAAGYARLERESTRTAAFAGEEINISVEQELTNPWSIDLGLSRSLGQNWTIGYGLSANLSGTNSHALVVSFSPSKK